MKIYLYLIGRIFQYKTEFIISILFLILFGFTSTILVTLVGPVFTFLFSLEKSEMIDVGSLLPVNIRSMLALNNGGLQFSKQLIILFLPLAIILLSLAKGISLYFQNYIMGGVSQKIIKDIRNEAFYHMIASKKSILDNYSVGSLTSMITNDTLLIQNALSKTVQQFIRYIITLILYLGMLVIIDPKLTMICLVLFPILGFFINKITCKIEYFSKLIQESLGRVASFISQAVKGIRVIKSYVGESRESEKFNDLNQGLYKVSLESIFVRTGFAPLMEFIAMVLFALSIYYALIQLKSGNMDPSGLLSFFALCGAMFRPFKEVSTVLVAVRESVGAMKNLFNFIHDESLLEFQQGHDLKENITKITYNNVNFAYKNQQVLNNIRCEIIRGERVAFVGHSGSGKTSLVRLLMRLYGQEKADTGILINGNSFEQYNLSSLRKQISFISGDPYLFHASIRDNITYGMKDVSEEEIQQAINGSGVSKFISTVPDGLDYVINPLSTNLSGGQKQRIALARAFLKKAPVLILDEATSSLDVGSEEHVIKGMDNLYLDQSKEVIFIIIAHRLNTVKNADKIYLMDKGNIVASGSHDQLLTTSDLYKRYVESFSI